MSNRQALLERLTYILASRVLLLAPPEYWQIPGLKWRIALETEIIELESLGLPEYEYKQRVKQLFREGMIAWWKELNRDITMEELVWWSWYANALGIRADNCGRDLMTETINSDYERFSCNVEKGKREGWIPSKLTPLTFAALLLKPPDVSIGQIPPGHSFWYAHGVKDAGQWNAMDGLKQLLRRNKNIKAVAKTFLGLLANKEEPKSDAERLEQLRNYTKRQYSFDAQLEDSRIIHKGYRVSDTSYDVRDDSQVDDSQAEAQRLRLIGQLKPRELDLFQRELMRLEYDKTREEWYGKDRAPKVIQRMKYLKGKYSK